jgi:hypothetical protein
MIVNSRTRSLILSFVMTASVCLFPPIVFSKDGIPVSIHGVNYTAEPFQYVISDPETSANSAGGEHVEPFSAGGIMCCYYLPEQWKPGLKARVDVIYWTKDSNNKNLHANKMSQLVDVPTYRLANENELWILRTPENGVELVLSDVQPNHRDWPGNIKGWPVASLTYRRERWEIYRKIAEGNVRMFRELLNELNDNPGKSASESWGVDKKYRRDIDLAEFSGPEDPKYRAYLKKRYESGIVKAENELKVIIGQKP